MAPVIALAGFSLIVLAFWLYVSIATSGGDPVEDDFSHGGEP